MDYNLDQIIDRRGTDSVKWGLYEPDVLPLWVADMDFRAPEPVIRAIQRRAEHGIFGYAQEPPELRAAIVEHLQQQYDWQVEPEAILFLPGVVVGFNMAIRAVCAPGSGVLAQTPVYYPILWAPPNAGCALETMELTRELDGTYSIDMDAFEAAISPRTRIFILCHPHNPVGRLFRRDELEHMAEICLRHDIVICSDEIHCDLVFDGRRHVPTATLDPEVARRTITLMAPSKTYNIAGLHFSMAIIEDKELRDAFQGARVGLVPRHLNVLAYWATLAAYREAGGWLVGLLRYLEANRNWLKGVVDASLPGITMALPEATYLAWLDCRAAGIPRNPHQFFLEQARVAVNDGATFGTGGEGFVRLNFGCPRATLEEAVARMRAALTTL